MRMMKDGLAAEFIRAPVVALSAAMALLGLLANVNLDDRGVGQDGTLEDHVEGAEAASIQLE